MWNQELARAKTFIYSTAFPGLPYSLSAIDQAIREWKKRINLKNKKSSRKLAWAPTLCQKLSAARRLRGGGGEHGSWPVMGPDTCPRSIRPPAAVPLQHSFRKLRSPPPPPLSHTSGSMLGWAKPGHAEGVLLWALHFTGAVPSFLQGSFNGVCLEHLSCGNWEDLLVCLLIP